MDNKTEININTNTNLINIQNCGCMIKKEEGIIIFIFPGASPIKFKQLLFETFDINSVRISKENKGIIYSIDTQYDGDIFDMFLNLKE